MCQQKILLLQAAAVQYIYVYIFIYNNIKREVTRANVIHCKIGEKQNFDEVGFFGRTDVYSVF